MGKDGICICILQDSRKCVTAPLCRNITGIVRNKFFLSSFKVIIPFFETGVR